MKCPAAVMRQGFLLSLPLLGLAFLQMSGCASSGNTSCLTPEAASYSAEEDSLGLTEFLALSPAEKKSRRRLAKSWLDMADSQKRADARLGSLSNAAGLAPDNPDVWLEQAHIWRWISNYVQASHCLENAAAAVRKLDSSYSMTEKKDAQRRTALARAWLHYDRAEYHEALRWARAAEDFSTGDKWVRQVKGLIEGSLNHRSQAHEIAGDILREDASDPDARWAMAALDKAQGKYREAFNYIADLRPDHEHSAECYRDKGEIAELLGEWAYARRWYAESAHALPFEDTACLSEITHVRLGAPDNEVEQPLYLAFDKYYVTGSLSAYAALALKQYDRLENNAEREFWAGQVVNASGTLVRKSLDEAWALRARGLVFADRGISNRAMRDLQRASRLLGEEGYQDARIEGMMGHLLLVDEDHEKALVHLQAALELDGTDPRIWTDMGLARIMADDEQAGEAAFTQALELDSNHVTAWYNRGLMYLHSGRLTEAETDLGRAAELAPDNPEIRQLLQQIKLQRRKN